jgi:polyisoprenyl-phosphate glycosyltransferase
MLQQSQQLLSIIVPCFNEEAVIEETHSRMTRMAARLIELEYEIIYVDDGSQDGTAAILEQLQETDPCVRVLRLSRNFGHQIAVTAGLEHAAGDVVALIDADLQDPPEVIPQMVARWHEGYDVAYGERVSRDGETHFKIATARVFYRVLKHLTETRIPLDAGDFRVMDRRVVEALRAMPECDRFVRGLVSWAGFRQIAVPYHRASRYAGRSKYPLSKMLRFAMDGIVGFSIAPLRAVMALGIVASLLAILGTGYAIALRAFTNNQIASGTALLLGLLFMGGVQLVSVGIVGEYVGRSYEQSKRRPLYFVRDRIGFEETTTPLRERREAQPRLELERAARLSVVKERGRATP